MQLGSGIDVACAEDLEATTEISVYAEYAFVKEEGYIANYKHIEDQKQGVLRVYLKYDANGKAVLQGIKRSSKPSLRIFKRAEELKNVLGSFGVAIVSTSKGMMSSKKAKQAGVGGEVIGYVW